MTLDLTFLCSPDNDSADHVYVNVGDDGSIASVSVVADGFQNASTSDSTTSAKRNKETETSRM